MPKEKKPKSQLPSLQQLRDVLKTRYTALSAQSRRHLEAISQQTRARLRTALSHPALSSRLNDDYLRGGGEILTAALALSAFAYLTHKGLYRYKTAADLPPRLIRRQGVLHGTVLSVGDGDGMRVIHMPLLRRWFGGRMAPRSRGVASITISVRLAGVDAPERAMGGFAAQPYARAAKDWLKKFAVGKEVVVKVHAMDQYRRVVATVYRKSGSRVGRWLGVGKKNVGLELARAGYAVVYEGAGAEYGGLEKVYRKVVGQAQRAGVGMWRGGSVISPMEFKKMVRRGGVDGRGLAGRGVVDGVIRFALWSYRVLKRLR